MSIKIKMTLHYVTYLHNARMGLIEVEDVAVALDIVCTWSFL